MKPDYRALASEVRICDERGPYFVRAIDFQGIARALERAALLEEFYEAWNVCEFTRGRYSCCDPHDIRCPKARPFAKGDAVCECGADRLLELEARLDAAEKAGT